MSDASTQSWSSVASMSTARQMCAAAAVGDTIYVFGGSDGGKCLSSVEAYNVSTRSWSSVASMSTKRSGCAAAAVGDTIFVFGGNGGSKALSSAEAYDVETRSWSPIAPMSTARYGCAAVAVGNTIFVFGGYGGGKDLSSAEAYNVETQTWSSVASMSTARFGCAAAAVGDSIFVFGGNDGGNWLSSAEAYDTRTQSWSPVASMSTARGGCAAAAEGDTVFVFGGYDGSKNLSSVEAYDVETRNWSPVASMSTERSFCAAAAVGDTVFVFGGMDGSKHLSSTEAYAPPQPHIPNKFRYIAFDEPETDLGPIRGIFDDEKNPVVPIQKAVASLPLELESELYVANQFINRPTTKEKMEKYSGLTPCMVAAIYLYTMESDLYKDLNELLRGEDRAKLRGTPGNSFFPYIRLLFSAVRIMSSSQMKMINRGIPLDLVAKYPDKYAEGETLIWWAFSSCTSRLSVLENPQFLGTQGARTICQIHTSKSVDVKEFSALSIEAERLLSAGCALKVTGVLPASTDGLTIITMEDDAEAPPLIS